jgi:hypothetical protein
VAGSLTISTNINCVCQIARCSRCTMAAQQQRPPGKLATVDSCAWYRNCLLEYPSSFTLLIRERSYRIIWIKSFYILSLLALLELCDRCSVPYFSLSVLPLLALLGYCHTVGTPRPTRRPPTKRAHDGPHSSHGRLPVPHLPCCRRNLRSRRRRAQERACSPQLEA